MSHPSALHLVTSFARLLALVFALSVVGCGASGGNGGDTTPPSAPTGLSATSLDAAIDLNWAAVQASDLAGYNVYRSTSPIGQASGLDPLNGTAPESGASYTDDRAQNGTTYHYVVTAVDGAGNESAPSGQVTKTPFARPPERP